MYAYAFEYRASQFAQEIKLGKHSFSSTLGLLYGDRFRHSLGLNYCQRENCEFGSTFLFLGRSVGLSVDWSSLRRKNLLGFYLHLL